MEKAAAFAEFDMLDSLAFVIHKISCEVFLWLEKIILAFNTTRYSYCYG